MEIQGTAEQQPFNANELAQLLALAKEGILTLIDKQAAILPGLKLWIPPEDDEEDEA